MAQIDNLRFQKTFVFNPGTEIAAAGVRPDQLTTGQVGFFSGKTGLSVVGAGLTNVNQPVLTIHQSLGDTKFGTVRTKPINVEKVRGWRAVRAKNATTQISYFGWNTTDGTLAAKVGDEIVFVITLYDNEITQWYGPVGLTYRLVPDASVWAGLAEGADISQSALADNIVAQINGTDAPTGQFPTTRELKNFVVATKVDNAGGIYGIKIETIAPEIQTMVTADPKQFHKPNIRSFTLGTSSGVAFKVKTTQTAKPGCGFPMEVVDLEKESQGYDRVRDQFEDYRYMKNNFILRAVDGTKYDFYYVDFEWTHHDSGLPKDVSDPYIVIFAVPTGTGAALETLLNNWLTPVGFTAVDIDAAENAKGDAEIENS